MTTPDAIVTRWRWAARIAFSAVLLCAGIFVILHGGYSPATEGWAAGIIGLVIGYWLR